MGADGDTKWLALRHLGNVLYAVQDTPSSLRPRAMEDALKFYNAHCPDRRVEWVDPMPEGAFEPTGK